MKKRLTFALALAVIFAAIDATALTLNPFKRAGRVKAETLIIAGNFVYSRLLADLSQYYSKQPILLVSPDVDGTEQLFFMPSDSKVLPMGPDEFMEAVEYVDPKRIIILGGDDYVPRKFIDLARAKYSVITLDSDNWSNNAAALGELLKIKKLQAQFDGYKDSLQNVDK